MLIPLMCAACGNQLSSVFDAKTGVFTHVHQTAKNAPNCKVTGKKYRIGHNGVEEFNG